MFFGDFRIAHKYVLRHASTRPVVTEEEGGKQYRTLLHLDLIIDNDNPIIAIVFLLKTNLKTAKAIDET